jgi:hypothetical protein
MRSQRITARPRQGMALLTTILLLLLLSTLLIGFMLLVQSGQRLTGINNSQTRAFYASEAGMEKMTADLGTLFETNFAPTAAQVNALTLTPPPLPGVQYLAPNGTNGYLINFPPDARGNPRASNITIRSGPYQGLIALATPYTLTVTARTGAGSEAKLQRTMQTVAIPAFQFGMFSQTDLSFFAGPNFGFGGRVHTNGNLFLAEGNGSTLAMTDRVTAVGDVIRTNLANGWPTANNYNGIVNVTRAPGTALFRALQQNEGSLVGTVGSAANPPWPNLSLGAANYAGNIRNGLTGARQLNLAIVTLGNGFTSPVDLIRRPVQGEDALRPGVLGERYYAQASLRVLISDNPADITQLPCVSAGAPFALADIAQPVPAWASAPAVALRTAMVNAGTLPVPLAASGAASVAAYNAGDGYWQPTPTPGNPSPIITGFIKIEAQTSYATLCGAWVDVTQEILSLGYAGKNLSPNAANLPGPALPVGPAANLGPSACADPHPNAVIRLERVRDNPSNAPGNCGVTVAGGVVAAAPPLPSDYWPNVFFDTREGTLRDVAPPAPFNNSVSLGGVMHYVELDVNNLTRWFTGAIGVNGPATRDPQTAPNNFVVYFSDRRGNFNGGGAFATGWPPLSPSQNETGEYGFQDFVNPGDPNGCPNGALDNPEDLSGRGGNVATYGQAPTPAVQAAMFPGANVFNNSLQPNPLCPVLAPSPIWPGWFVAAGATNEARENRPLFFRRALKLVNGGLINLGPCPGGANCGLTVASENPAYVQGDFNANSAGGGFNDAHVAVAVLADAFTFLSNNWNDVNSFGSPYNTGGRLAQTTWFRLAVVAGKGINFQQPAGTAQDFGTDGGAHNFLRYLENWGGQGLNYRGSIVSMFFNRQATGVYKCCATVYSPPTRGYVFDVEFLQPNLLPPRTPMFRDVNTTGFTQLLLPTQ